MQPDRLDKVIRWLMVFTVLAVATFAFIQSYSHIFDLAQTHHEKGAALRLLPLSVDWLILAAGLVLLNESRKGLKPPLPKAVLWVGIIATLFGNVAALFIYGPVATIIGAWAPVSLVLTVEMGMYLVRSAAKPGAKEAKPPAWKSVNELRAEDGLEPVFGGDEVPAVAAPVVPEAVGSPGDSLQGWGQLGRQEPASQGLQGIGLANGRR